MDFKKIKKLAEAQQDYMVEMRRYFHTHAEVSDHEFGTRKVLQRELDSLNIPYELLEGTGIIPPFRAASPVSTACCAVILTHCLFRRKRKIYPVPRSVSPKMTVPATPAAMTPTWP